MYADYTTDSSYSAAYETDREGPTSSTTATTPAPSYPPRSSSFSHNNSNASHGTSNTQSRPGTSQESQPQSPKELASVMKSPSPPAQPPSTSSPFSASPRQSEEIQVITTQAQLPNTAFHVPQRRNSVSASITSDRITTQYAPSVELPTVDDPAQASFDEGILRSLCEIDYGIPLLLDRIKQSMVSCRELSTFFKKRAIVEDEYGRTLQKAARTAGETYAANDGKSGTYVTAWQSTMKLHEVIAENRLKFAAQLHQSVEDLANLAREVEKNRKTTKDLASRYERNLQESEEKLEKAKQRCDAAHDELEKLLIAKEGESLKEVGSHSRNGGPSSGKRAIGKAVAKGGMLLKGKNPTSMLKQEEEIRARLSSYSDAYGQAVQQTQAMRQEYFNFQLPRILRSLKECLDELDFGTQYHLSRYAYMFETAVLNDGSTLVPAGGIEDGPGMKPIAESIDSRGDFKTYMQNYALATGRPSGPRREGPVEDGFLPPLPKHIHANDHPLHSQASDTRQTASASTGSSQTLHNGTATNGTSGGTAPAGTGSAPTPSYPPAILAAMQQHPDRGRPTFGISLSEQMARDAVEVPKIVQKCCEAIEAYGLRTVGIYRLSGTTSRIQKLKVILDRDLDNVDLMADEWRMDVNNVTSVLKLWLRELPEPLLTFGLYQGYIDAAKAENERLRHIQLHHRVNDLPDANYATLKYLMGHLHKVRELETINSMTASNLSIVFGPTLLGPPPPSMAGDGSTSGGTTLQDMNWQCRAVETIIEHYTDIFVDEGEEA